MPKPTIFVQIASYRDPECQWTVKDLFDKAAFPERVNVGICWQYEAEEDQDCFMIASPHPEQTRTIHTIAHESQGVCWARNLSQSLYDGETYVLMIDSHMRFIPGWDEELIKELEQCPSKKPFLSCYPPGYMPPDQLDPNPKCSVMRAKQFDDRGDIRFEGENLVYDPEKPLHGAFLACGFIFAKGSLVTEVPYDPYLYFNHEEVCFAARAYTHGWDVYSATRPFVYHYYHTGNQERRLHWSDNKEWALLLQRSRERYNHLLCRQETQNQEALTDLNKYDLGTERSLEDFEAWCGIDFQKKEVSERGLRAMFIENIEQYRYTPDEETEKTVDASA